MIQARTLPRFCIAILYSLVLLFVSTSLVHAQGKAHLSDEFVTDRVLVSFHHGTSAQDMQTAHGQAGGRVLKSLSGIGVQVIEVPEGRVRAAIATYERNPHVQFAEPNYKRKLYLPNTSEGAIPSINVANSFTEQWGLNNTGQNFGVTLDPLTLLLIAPAYQGVADADMDVPEGWAMSHGSSAIKIAILDSGVSCQHADLNGKCLETKNFVADHGSPNQDLVGHGTHVAGIAAAKTNNSIGVAGVAREAMVGSMKVCYEDMLLIDFGIIQAYCNDADIAEAIQYAADQGYHIINMSLAGPSPSSTLQNAVNYAWNAGLVLVAGAGNEYGTGRQYPAAFDHVMAVAATDYYDNLASFSTFSIDSDDWVSVAAPGHVIFSTVPGELCNLPPDDPDGCYDWKSGTSMATPMVSGVVAVVWGANPQLNNTQIRDLVQNSADTVGALGQNFLAWTRFGRVNLHAALSTQTGGGGPVEDTEPPIISMVAAERINGTRFRITWQTNEASTSSVTFASGDVYTDNTLTTNHSMSFRGSKGGTYTYEVSSADGVGNAATAGPFDYTIE